MKNKAVFLDQDGTLIFPVGVRNARKMEEVRIYPDVPRALSLLKAVGYMLVVVTNQGAVGAGQMTIEDVHSVHEGLQDLLTLAKAPMIDAFYWCPHEFVEGVGRSCACGKPNAGMLEQAAMDLNLNLAECSIIGDDPRDVEAGKRAGLRRSFLVSRDGRMALCSEADWVFPSVYDAARTLALLRKE